MGDTVPFAVTEVQWLNPSDDDDEGRYYFLDGRGLLTDRKHRLFGCACVREAWDELPDEALRQAVLTCERYADGGATDDELRAAGREANQLASRGTGDIVADHSAIAVRELCHPSPFVPLGEGSTSGMSAVVAELRFDDQTPWDVARRRAKQVHCHLLRDIFGNPFRPVQFDAAWFTSTVTALATGIYADKAFDRMPILADALEEAGCDNADVLTHCRGSGPHVRGCWVVDQVLGKK